MTRRPPALAAPAPRRPGFVAWLALAAASLSLLLLAVEGQREPDCGAAGRRAGAERVMPWAGDVTPSRLLPSLI